MEKSTPIIKVDTAENWAKAKNYIPDIFTIIIYNYPGESPRVKIGDGVKKVNELPFLGNREVNDDTLEL